MNRLLRCAGALALLLAALGALAAPRAVAQTPTCERPVPFNPANFTSPTRITNQWLPLVPGVQTVLEGEANRGQGALSHTVTFTVTDVTKQVGGIKAVVAWDVDRNQGQVVESELSFWAQDNAGNVWNLGEYPEEYQGGTLLGAPATWIAGLAGAEPGIHMLASPTVSNTYYLQGLQPDIEFMDCAHVMKTGQQTTTPFASYSNVLVTEETSPLDPAGGFQWKFHAPGVGIVRVEPYKDPEGELLELTNRRVLTSAEMAAVRSQVHALDTRGHTVSEVYAQTPPVQDPPPPPPPPPPPVVTAPKPNVSALTRARARALVRKVVRRHLRAWRITGPTCRLRSAGRATCVFAARRTGARLRGRATVRRTASRALRVRVTVRIRRLGCRPADSRRCSRTRRWSS